MNYVGVMIESVAANLYKKHLLCFSKTINPTVMNILQNALASPLLAFSAISNFYFFGGKDIGDIFLKRIFGKQSLIENI